MTQYYFNERMLERGSNKQAEYGELKNLLDNTKEVDKQILKAFPLESNTDMIYVNGSYNLIEAYKWIKEKAGKLDIITEFRNITLKGFTDIGTIILDIKLEEDGASIEVKGDKVASDQLYECFKMKGYAHLLIEHKLLNILEPNVQCMLYKFRDKTKQFRMMLINEEYVLRSITSTHRYRNYDNNVILYVVLSTLHKMNKDIENQFKISYFHLTESNLLIYIRKELPTYIPNIGELYFEARITNDETSQGSIWVELHYRFYDPITRCSFSCLPPTQKALIELQHSAAISKAVEEFQKIGELSEKNNLLANYIEELSTIPVLTEEIAFSLCDKIINSKGRDISKSLKDNIREEYTKRLTETTYSLIEGFNIATILSENIEEKTALKRIFYNQIMEIVIKKSRNKKTK